MEILTYCNRFNSKISWYENNGSESFNYLLIKLKNLGKINFAIDLDNDGDIDIFSFQDDKVEWYENNGIKVLLLGL